MSYSTTYTELGWYEPEDIRILVVDEDIEEQLTLKPVTNYVNTIRVAAIINSVNCSEDNVQDKGVSVELKIGAEKLYVVKNIYELIDHIKNKNVHQYGKFLEFKHELDTFEPQSRGFLEKILQNSDDFLGIDTEIEIYTYVI